MSVPSARNSGQKSRGHALIPDVAAFSPHERGEGGLVVRTVDEGRRALHPVLSDRPLPTGVGRGHEFRLLRLQIIMHRSTKAHASLEDVQSGYQFICSCGSTVRAERSNLELLRNYDTSKSDYGSSRIRMFLNSMGEPSDSRHRYPIRGSHPFPPETSSPLTYSRTSPLMA
jgi:hypothetical protein